MKGISLYVTIAVVLLDQGTKYAVERLVPAGESVPFLYGLVHITHVRNPGAAFGILPNKPLFLISLAVIIGMLLIAFGDRLGFQGGAFGTGLGFVLGGALGNLIDRLRVGKVIDFIDIHVWPVFNVADLAIVVGMVLVFWGMVKHPQLGSAGEGSARE